MEEQTSSFSTDNFIPVTPSPKKGGGKRFVLLLILLILLVGGGYAVATHFLKSSVPFIGSKPTPTPTAEVFPTDTPFPTEETSPTPKASGTPAATPTTASVDKTTGLDRSKLSVSVKNGSGIVGAASKMSDYLKGLGYDVTSVGNADNFDYENISISINSDFSKYLSLLKSDIGKQYTVGSTSADLSASSSADAVVIIGK